MNDGPNSVNFGPTSDDEMMVMIMMYVTDTTGLATDLDVPPGVAPGVLNISPNPSTGQVNINVPGFDEWLTLKVYDVTGKVVFQTSFQGPANSIDLSAYNSSMYFIRVQDLNGKIDKTKRIILTD